MCVTPNFVWMEKGPGYMKQTVPCRNCWRCQQRRTNDYVGRCLAEAAYSDWTVTLTLTYAPITDVNSEDYLADKVLTPGHFQAFVRKLRRRGHNIRYFVAGEYGEQRGRAHFHAILFGIGPKPVWDIKPEDMRGYPGEANRLWDAERKHGPQHWPQQVNFHMHEWPHGHVYADWSADVRAIRYAAKYLNKREPGRSWFSVSKKPALGAAHFAALAARCVAHGVLPAALEYVAPGDSERKQRYLITGASRRDYLLAIIDGWCQHRPLDMARLNEWVRAMVEKALKQRAEMNSEYGEMQEFLDTLREQLDRIRPTAEQVAASLRSSQFWKYLYDPQEEMINGAESQRKECQGGSQVAPCSSAAGTGEDRQGATGRDGTASASAGDGHGAERAAAKPQRREVAAPPRNNKPGYEPANPGGGVYHRPRAAGFSQQAHERAFRYGRHDKSRPTD